MLKALFTFPPRRPGASGQRPTADTSDSSAELPPEDGQCLAEHARELATEAALATAIDGTPGALVNFWSYTQMPSGYGGGEPGHRGRPHRHR